MSSNPYSRPVVSPQMYQPHHQPEAGPSRPKSHNPQLSSEPWFAYPSPPTDVIDGELPPYLESENVPMGPLLDRLARKSHVDLRTLVEATLPKLESRQKPREVIAYAKNTRQAVLKYLAVLRWKTAVDVPTSEPPLVNGHGTQQASFPTPHSNGDSSSPIPGGGKGKGKMEDGSKSNIRGKVTDAKRITEYLLYQNSQHDMTVNHVRHSAQQIESLRIRNPDLLTALSLVTQGTYTRYPTAITEAFVPRAPLTNGDILDTLRRLDAHILYRLKCVDYVPPDIRIDKIKDGRAYIIGGSGDWRAELSLTGFGKGDQGRWWMTGLEWNWKSRVSRTDSSKPGRSAGKRFKGNERQQILDTLNREVLPGADPGMDNSGTSGLPRAAVSGSAEGGAERGQRVDAPLVRFVNYIQHLSLSYQLEVLLTQAVTLSREKWRNQLAVEVDRSRKSLSLRYWIRPRTGVPPAQKAQARRPGQPVPPAPTPSSRSPAFGAKLTISLGELDDPEDEADILRREITACDDHVAERVLRLGLKVKWEIDEGGVGGGWKAGQTMDTSSLRLDSQALDIEDILLPATRAHAVHLTRHHTMPQMALATPLISPSLHESEARPLALHISIPSRQRRTQILVWVSPVTGLLEIEDEGARLGAGSGGEERSNRARLATNGVNTGMAKLGDALKRLIIAIFTDNLENQIRQLGWLPARKLPVKLNELAKNDLTPASTIFVPLPTSTLHYLVVKVSTSSIEFELLRLAREPAENGVGMKLAIRDRSPMDLQRLRQRHLDAKCKRKREEGDAGLPVVIEPEQPGIDVSNRDLRDLYVFSNALVARMLVEQQLKDRAIPYSEQYPPALTEASPAPSAIAGLIPNIVVNAKDLLNDGRAADVAMPKVFLQIKDWWKAGKCQVVTVVQLRHRAASPTNGASPGFNNASTSSAARAEGISFDQASSIVRFTAKEISRCVPAFLEQWERLSKVIMVAGDVARLNKLAVFKDLRMLSFDLRTATFTYSPGYNASITYSPNSDSYECTFFRSSTPQTPATPLTAGGNGDSNPHEALAALLSHRLNELAQRADVKKGTVGRGFISLLRNTLPILLEIDAIRSSSQHDTPKLVVTAVDEYRLVWDTEGPKRYAMDLLLTHDERYLITDASAPSFDGLVDLSCGPLTPIPSFSAHIDKIHNSLRTSHATNKSSGAMAVKLDKGSSMAVSIGIAGEAIRGLCAEIELNLSGGKGRGA